MADSSAFFSGLFLGFSLIIAIGAQNAFVLKQGLKNQHLFKVCLICALSDAILVSLGVSGFGVLIEGYPEIIMISRYGGAAFLTLYGVRSLWNGFTVKHSLEPANTELTNPGKVILICLGFTWLNPHVYLDTVILLGGISTQYDAKIAFAGGAVLASFLFFFSLGYGARKLTPIFHRPNAWKVLDLGIGVTMLSIAGSLLVK